MRRLLLIVCLVLPTAIRAQPTGTCQFGMARGVLELGRVRADVYNTGALFFGSDRTNGDGYIVPRSGGRSPIFAVNLWLAGSVDGTLRVSAARYSNFTFRPGPLADAASPPSDCTLYDRIYSVTRQDVVDYYRTGIATADLRDWPASLGAPVVDGDGVAGNYDLAGGDQPALRGDAVTWWIMNDASGARQSYQLGPLGVEVQVEAFGFDTPPLDLTTFYRYTVVNRNAVPVDSVYAGLFADTDLGNASDDYVGTDTTSAMVYAYNADNIDEGSYGYGTAPPAIGFQVVRGPVGLSNGRDDDGDGLADEPDERLRLTASFNIRPPCASCTSTDPDNGRQAFNTMRGLWPGGYGQYEFGLGNEPTQGRVTRFSYAGDPVTGKAWSEVNNGTATPANAPGDRRFVAATGPFRLAPGASETFTFAVVYGRGASNLDSVTRLRALAAGILHTVSDPAPRPIVAGPRSPAASGLVSLSRPYPNPFTARAVLRYEMPVGTPLRATLHDVLGRQVAVLADGPADASGEIAVDGSRLAPGVYRVRVVVPAGEEVLTLVRAR